MTDPVKWSFIESVFFDALDLPAIEQEAFVRKCCAEDSDSAEEVLSLLAAHFDGPPLIDGSILTLGLNILAGNAEDESPARVGRYRITRELGQGGMAVVYLAEREEGDFQHRVAVKVMRGGRESRSLLARFVTERQVLATLDHPNIARLYDGGVTDRGLPYIVMEYVDGVAFLEYCRKNLPELEDRLRLFVKVCDAVQHAHRNLIVHRDLKPGNILVLADGTPKLLDFGIAKIFRDDFKNTLAQTAAEERLLTPAYASPEQIRGKNITTATDVYSLGVILYELLSGDSPYSNSRDSYEELIAAICDREPVRPGAAVEDAGDEELSEVERRRRKKRISGDLDTIVLKALAKDPARRYASVEQMAEDIRRHLDGLPISARPDTVRYRVAKFVKRNRWQTAAAMLVMASMLGGTGVALWQARKAEQARLKTEQSNQKLVLNSIELIQINQDIASLAGATKIREKLISQCLRTLDGLNQNSDENLENKIKLGIVIKNFADLQGRVGFGNKGNLRNALEGYRKSEKLFEEAFAKGIRNDELLWEFIEGENHFGAVLQRLGDLTGSKKALQKSVSQLEIMSLESELRIKAKRSIDYRHWGLLAYTSNYQDSIEIAERMLYEDEDQLKKNPKDKKLRVRMIQSLLALGQSYSLLAERFESLSDLFSKQSSEKPLQKALEYFHHAHLEAEFVLKSSEEKGEYESLLNIARIYEMEVRSHSGSISDLKEFEREVSKAKKNYLVDKENFEAAYLVLYFQRCLAIRYISGRNFEKAINTLRQVQGEYNIFLKMSPENGDIKREISILNFFEGVALEGMGRNKEANDRFNLAFRDSVEIFLENPVADQSLYLIPSMRKLVQKNNGTPDFAMEEILKKILGMIETRYSTDAAEINDEFIKLAIALTLKSGPRGLLNKSFSERFSRYLRDDPFGKELKLLALNASRVFV
jgi:non-specific serine/threonine protein kinase/serine/threonine-protein kinase